MSLKTQELRFISDPGHGWLEVPREHLDVLGIANAVSPFSYWNEEMVYLEEDDDARLYFQALKEKGYPKPPIREVYEENTPIRSYRRVL